MKLRWSSCILACQFEWRSCFGDNANIWEAIGACRPLCPSIFNGLCCLFVDETVRLFYLLYSPHQPSFLCLLLIVRGACVALGIIPTPGGLISPSPNVNRRVQMHEGAPSLPVPAPRLGRCVRHHICYHAPPRIHGTIVNWLHHPRIELGAQRWQR